MALETNIHTEVVCWTESVSLMPQRCEVISKDSSPTGIVTSNINVKPERWKLTGKCHKPVSFLKRHSHFGLFVEWIVSSPLPTQPVGCTFTSLCTFLIPRSKKIKRGNDRVMQLHEQRVGWGHPVLFFLQRLMLWSFPFYVSMYHLKKRLCEGL